MNKQGKELKKLVKNFRHNDLRLLLVHFKKNSKGKKTDLVDKVNDMIDNYCSTNSPTLLAAKIHELSKKLGLKSYCSPNRLPVWNFKNVPKGVSKASASTIKYPSTSSSLLKSKQEKSYMQYFPDVTFRRLPFYDTVTELMKPTAVNNDANKPQYAKYSFSLTPAQVDQIKKSEVLQEDFVVEYHFQVILRFCLIEITSEQDDNYPMNLVVHVNNKSITLPSYNMPTNASVQPKRPNRPLDITFACVLNPINVNNIHLSWSTDPMHTHCFTVTLAKRLSCDSLLKQLRQNCYRHPDHTRALVKEKLAASLDSEISFTCLKICLLCPLSKMKMRVPTRSIHCNHLQCFDATTFLQMNEKKPTWTCPICDKSTRFESLIIDGLFLEILDQAPNATEIQFLEDGSWKDIKTKKMETKSSNLDSSVLCYEIADSPKSEESKSTIVLENPPLSPAYPPLSYDPGVIDLTGDSEEEEMASEPTIDSTDYLSSNSSSPNTPFDLLTHKKPPTMNLLESIFQDQHMGDFPPLDTPILLLNNEGYNDPPDLVPM